MTDIGEGAVCQSCGKRNEADALVCEHCGAKMPLAFKKEEERKEMEQIFESLPPEGVHKIQKMLEDISENPKSLALHMQIANLYKGYGIKHKAVEHLQIADEIQPGNVLVKQRLDQLTGKAQAIPSSGDTRPIKDVGKIPKWIPFTAGAVVVAIVVAVALVFLFPSDVRVAGYKEHDALNPKFSPDGKYIAYIKTPKFSIGRMMDDMFSAHNAMAAGQPAAKRVDTWLMVKPFPRGDEVAVASFSAGEVWSMRYEWIPGEEALIYEGRGDGYKPMVYKVDMASKTPEALLEGHSPAISHDGKYIAYLGPDKHSSSEFFFMWEEVLKVYDMQLGSTDVVSGIEAEKPVWSPAENLVVFQGKPIVDRSSMFEDPFSAGDMEDDFSWYYSADVYTYKPGGVPNKLTNDGLSNSPFFTPDGDKIVFHRHADKDKVENMLMEMDKSGGPADVLLVKRDEYEGFGSVSFSPDGERMAFEGIFVNPDKPVTDSMATPIGVFGGEANYVTDVFVIDKDGSDLVRMESSRHRYKMAPVFHPAKDWIAYQVEYIDLHKEIWASKAP